MKFRPLRNLIRFGLSTKFINMGLFIKIMVGSSRLLDYVNRSTFEQISSPWRKRESCTVLFSSSSLTFRLKLLVWEPKYSRSSPTSAPFLPRFLFSWLSDFRVQNTKPPKIKVLDDKTSFRAWRMKIKHKNSVSF